MAFEAARGTDRYARVIRYVMLFLSAVLIVTGLIGKGRGYGELAVDVVDTPAPTIDLAAYDETHETRDITLSPVTWHAVQLGAFESEDSAIALAEDFKARGAAGYVYHDTRYRVLAAMYESGEDVAAVRAQLKDLHSIDTYAFEIALPEITLRVGGARGQLDVLSMGYEALIGLVEALNEAALLIDRQELTLSELTSSLAQTRSDIALLSSQLALRFSVPRHASIEELISAFGSFEDFMVSVENTSHMSLARLAAAAKHEAFSLLDALRRVYQGFQT